MLDFPSESHNDTDAPIIAHETAAYRLFLAIASVLLVAYGFMYQWINPEAVDPIWGRLLVGILPLVLIFLSYKSTRVKENLPRAWRFLLYVVTIWCVGITALNHFRIEYTIGLIVVIAVVSAVITIGVQSIRPVLYYLAFACILPGLALFTAPSVASHHIVLMAAVITFALLFYPVSLLRVWRQTELRKSEARYRALIEQASDGIFICTLNSGFEQVNERTCELTGYTREELLARRPEDIIAEESSQHYPFPYQKILAGETARYELEFRRKDGSSFPAEVSVKLIEGRMIQAIVRDITERKRAEQVLESSEAKFRSLAEKSPLGIYLYQDEVFTYVNPRAAALLDYPIDELIEEQTLEHLIRPEHFPVVRENVQRCIEGVVDTVNCELQLRTREGEVRPVEVYGSRIIYEGKPAILGWLVDITERLQREEALIAAKEEAEEMSRLKSSFLANMSHEIRTPLASILGYADLLNEETSPELQKYIRPIQLSSNRLFDTLNSVLDIAQLESGSMKLAPQFLDIARLVEETVETFDRHGRDEGLYLRVEAEPSQIQVYLDRGALVRILNNLIGNAIKFTKEGGITVRVRADEKNVWLEVEDTGIGIDETYLSKLYQAFSQESTGESRKYEGAGLGLAITHQLVKLVGGSIEVDSTKGTGTVFTVQLPRLAEHIDIHADAYNTGNGDLPQRSEPALLPPEQHTLVVDDDSMTRALLHDMLPSSYHVDTVEEAAAALKLAETNTYDLVLMDINLGDGFDGVEVLHRLRESAGYSDTLMLAMTAYAMPGDRERFLKAGFDGYLSKPFVRETLFGHLFRLFERSMHEGSTRREEQNEGETV